jgi:arylsulfatase A-like enzyme
MVLNIAPGGNRNPVIYVPVPGGFAYDGEDRSAAWLGTPSERKRPLFWEYGRKPDYLYPGAKIDHSPNVAMRDGRWKLLVNADGSGVELYDILADPKETTNLAERNPEVTARLKEAALAWRRSLP